MPEKGPTGPKRCIEL